ncbi:HAD family hydrolase [Caulobacter sp. NIBR2454]|uniref:HAD family hydrolase n=1 Tax=Caulobacter sp. NIBR2454 TaxID=3015996 RepID=UPI0022B6F8D5|nr:HAD family hydrolase [Caulobacter sp. NIBR2454]
MKSALKAVMFDRDGVLNLDEGYTHRPQDLVWTPGATAAIRRLNAAGLKVIVVTNQSGVARGLYDLAAVDVFHAEMQRQLAEDGATIDAFYACPFHKDAQVEIYRHIDHPDRKPNPGMLLSALRDFGLNAEEAVMIGDRESDMEAARRAGMVGHLYEGGDLDALVAKVTA